MAYPFYPQGYPMQYPYQPVQQPATQGRTVEVIPVDTEDQINSWQVTAGTTVQFMARNDAFVAFKSVGLNGEATVDFYDRRPPAPPPPVFDPGAYVRKDELAALLASVREAE